MADLCSENTTETVRNGFLELGVVQVWQVITANRQVTADTVLQDPGLPGIGTSQVFGTYPLWLINRQTARVDADDTGRKWNVTCTWSNMTGNYARDVNGDPVQDPTDAVKSVQVEFQEYAQPITDAVYKNQTEVGSYEGGVVLSSNPPWINTTDKAPVRLSTGEPVLAERVAYTEVITVERNERDWNDTLYKPYSNAINQLQVVITESDSEGVRATNTYPEFTLRMKPITKIPFWQDAKMYYRIRFEMEYNELTWIHAEQDRSINYRVYVDGYDGKGNQWVQADVDKAGTSTGKTYAWKAVTMNDKTVAAGEPQKLNGYGTPMPWTRGDTFSYLPDNAIYMNYDIYPIMDYTPLGL